LPPKIKPILQQRCQLVTLVAGDVRALPFDVPDYQDLGTKLFTRLKDEKRTTAIREFLDKDEITRGTLRIIEECYGIHSSSFLISVISVICG